MPMQDKFTHRKSVKLSLAGYRMDTLMTRALISVTSQSKSRQFSGDASDLSHRLDLGQPGLVCVTVLKSPQDLHVGTVFAFCILKI